MSKIECSVCCAEVKSAISCLACKYISCISCAQQFLLSTHNARCMNCSHAWDELFIRNTFPKSWVEKQYKDHRKASLIDIEKSYLAESMPYVEQYKQIKAYETAAVELEEKTKDYIMDLQKQLETLTISLREPSIFKKRTTEAVNKKIKIKQQIQDVTNEVRNS